MGVRLVNENDDSICVDDMEDGQIGVIVAWVHREYIGRIVQRHSSSLISIGCVSGQAFSCFFNASKGESSRVRILQPGEKIEITND